MKISRPEPSDERPRARRASNKRQELIAALREAAGSAGWVTFATFMDLALFHPEAGYYARLEAVGAEGDFSTSPSLTPVFGRLFFRQFHQIWRHMGMPSRFDLIELGPGGGQFAESVLAAASGSPRFMRALRYGLVERSTSLTSRQQERLSRWNGQVRWAPTLQAVAPDGLSGVVFSNEFFDALPCHVLQMTPDGLQEVAVRITGDRLDEVLVAPTSPRLAEVLEASGVDLQPGQRAEVSIAARDAVNAIGRCLHRGVVVTVDYGDTARELYTPRRMAGTVRGFFRHMAVTDPYLRPGEQDLTYDVDFTALAHAGEQAGLKTLGLLPQGEVLKNLGLEREIQAMRRGKSPLMADQAAAPLEKLAQARGMGEGFKVLFQAKGLERADIAGLGGADLPRFLWPWQR